jgi:TrmH family RNA methyltransferase
MEADDPMQVLDSLAGAGRRTLGASATQGVPYDEADLAHSCALVVGNEAHGLGSDLAARLDGLVTVPMDDRSESLNVAMATTVLLFEAARQRRTASA